MVISSLIICLFAIPGEICFSIMDCDNILQIVENLSFLDIIVTQKMGRLHLHPEHHRIERVIFGCCEIIKTEV